MLKYAEENRSYSPILLKDEAFLGKYLTVCYDRLGVAITEYDTDYDLDAGYDYVFLSYPGLHPPVYGLLQNDRSQGALLFEG